jgi:hypothetical protein
MLLRDTRFITLPPWTEVHGYCPLSLCESILIGWTRELRGAKATPFSGSELINYDAHSQALVFVSTRHSHPEKDDKALNSGHHKVSPIDYPDS